MRVLIVLLGLTGGAVPGMAVSEARAGNAEAEYSIQEPGTGCGRECLRDTITLYLDALIAHDPGALPLADSVRFTEDTVEMPLGEGIWASASSLGGYRQDILDLRQGVAAALVVLEESGAPVLLVLRIKVEDRKIAEVETMVVRDRSEGVLFNVDALETPREAMALVPERGQLMPREEAIRIAEYYPAGLTIGDFVAVDAPFASDAYRLENGTLTAGPGCARPGCENIKTQRIIEHPDLTYRVAAVDEEMGIVLLRLDFGDTGSYGEGNALIVWEAFKVHGRQIHAVEAFMEIMPATAGSGWD